MRLSAKIIQDFASINGFTFGDEWQIRAGEPNTLYFQVVDLDKDSLRYLTGLNGNTPVAINVTFPSIDDSAVITVAAVQVDSADSSVWKVSLTSAQTPFSGNVVFSVTEGANTRKFSILNGISVEYPGQDGSC